MNRFKLAVCLFLLAFMKPVEWAIVLKAYKKYRKDIFNG
jgi:hypothetical protein